MRFRARALCAGLLCAALGGCVTPPPAEPPAAAEAAATPPEAPPMAIEAERILRERADKHMEQGRWADALLQWELLVLLRPDAQTYREQAERTRRTIREAAGQSLARAEQARRSGNLDRAVIEYLRVLSVDRENARAAQGLRDIERERTRRNYMNRPPRVVM